MNKAAAKKLINDEFGFSASKIDLLEGSTNDYGKFEYIMFSVCGIEYQMNFDFSKGCYTLKVYDSHGLIEKEF